MKAVLIRTGSAPVLSSSLNGSPKFSLSDLDSVTEILFSGKKSTLHLGINDKNKKNKENLKSIRRSLSENDVIRSSVKVSVTKSRSFPAIIPEEDEEEEDQDLVGTMILKKKNVNLDNYDRMSGIWGERNVLKEENEYFGGGLGKGRNIGGGNGGNGSGNGDLNGGNADQSNMSEYYQKLLKSNPGNPLILRNYGKFLHEIKGDDVKAEECYGRAILANPGDGELLSLYGKLVWDSSKDGVRAQSYFDQAVQAAPDDCYVMGSYANFLWNSEEDEEEEWSDQVRSTSSALVKAC